MPHKPLTRERVQRLAADPGERSKLPVSVLQKYGFGDLARKRMLQQRLDAPVVPGSQMSNRDLAHQAGALTTVQYGQPIALAQRQAQQAPDYYAVYAKALRDSASAAQAQGVQSGQAIQGLYRSGPNAPDSPQSTIGQAQAGTAQLLGDAGRNYLNTMAAAAVGQGVQSRNLALQKEADLKKEAGAFNVAQRGQISRQEAQNVATNLVAGGNLALGQGRLAVQQQNAQTARQRAQSTTSHQAQTSNDPYLQKYGMSRSAFLALSPGERQKLIVSTKAKPKGSRGAKGPAPTSGPGSLAPGLENKYVGQVDKAAGLLKDGKLPSKDPKTKNIVYQPATQGQIIDWLKAHGVDPHIIGIANSLVANNMRGVGKHGVDHAHALGIHVGGRWKIVTGPRKPGAQQSPH